MAKNKFTNLNRKIHRSLGLVIGVQFLFWTIGGMYFAFSDLDEIHGDHQRKHVMLKNYDSIVSPSLVLTKIKEIYSIDSLESLKLISILDKPVYQIIYHHDHMGSMQMAQLADAMNGDLLPPLTKEQGLALAQEHFNTNATVKSVTYLDKVNRHHEYREKPLPAWAITFDHPSNTTVYVSANLGTVESFRNSKWRVFDFLWMLHTMDYTSRDNFSNILLRAFSIFGLATITSGFILFFSTRVRKNKKNK